MGVEVQGYTCAYNLRRTIHCVLEAIHITEWLSLRNEFIPSPIYLFIFKIPEQDFVFVQIIAFDFIPVFNPYEILVWCKFHSGLCKVKINFVLR